MTNHNPFDHQSDFEENFEDENCRANRGELLLAVIRVCRIIDFKFNFKLKGYGDDRDLSHIALLLEDLRLFLEKEEKMNSDETEDI